MTEGNGDPRKGGAQPQVEEKKLTVDYPTDYTFKVMGLQAGDFRDYVLALFERLMGSPLASGALSEQPSSKGKYISINVTVFLTSEEQRRTIYAELHRDVRVVYYL
ncbi:MAG TPA: DUF493 domain-containing protein [Aggregicoccus sp.]|nr:DUF493 domain-containing protein [Aggregicoccus sp.]